MKNSITLQLNKRSIAKLNDAQLGAVKGGNQPAAAGESVVVNCQVRTATVVNTKAVNP
jgi:hypothetical protein